jgi:hypothetical protein
MRYVGRRRSETNPLASIPLFRPADPIMKPFDPMPAAPMGPYTGPQLPPSEQELLRRELANAEAALAELVNTLRVARAGIGEANRTHTAPVMSGNRVLYPAQRFSAERMRERKSAAFRLFNKRRGQIAAARRRVEAARAAMKQPSLMFIEERAATAAAVRVSKRVPVHRIAPAATAV